MVFDVDGTLVGGPLDDDELYVKALADLREIPGVGQAFSLLQRSDDCRVAIAPGAWKDSITTKLAHVGIDMTQQRQ